MKTTIKINDINFVMYFVDGNLSLNQAGFYFSRSFNNEKDAIENVTRYLKEKTKKI